MRFCPECGTGLGRKEAGGLERNACPSPECSFVEWNNPTPVVAAIVQAGEDVILVRGRGWPEKMFGLVTGFLEAGEEPGDAAMREVREELGLESEMVGLVGIYGFFAMNQLIIAYHLRVQGDVQLGDELEAFKRIPIAKLRPWEFGTGAAVRDWLKTRAAG